MCGIAGIVRYGKMPILEEQISLLLVGNEHRGNDAAGLALSQADGTILVCKTDDPAWKFVKSEMYKKFIEEHLHDSTWAALCHTRAATKGNPRDNRNNHPIYAGLSAIIHNGILRNDDELFHKMSLGREAESDSDILRAILDKYGFTKKGCEALAEVNGSAAGAAFHIKYPGHILLFRSGAPMSLGSTGDYFMFASEKKTIYRAFRPYIQRWGMWFQMERANAAFAPMHEDTIWILGPKGYQAHHIFKAITGNYNDSSRQVYDGYKSRQSRFNLFSTRKTAEEKNNPAIQSKTPVDCIEVVCQKCNKDDMVIPKEDKLEDYCCKYSGCRGKLAFKSEVVN
jgi:asparagine synthetase B (glutamine-hydrolysing)